MIPISYLRLVRPSGRWAIQHVRHVSLCLRNTHRGQTFVRNNCKYNQRLISTSSSFFTPDDVNKVKPGADEPVEGDLSHSGQHLANDLHETEASESLNTHLVNSNEKIVEPEVKKSYITTGEEYEKDSDSNDTAAEKTESSANENVNDNIVVKTQQNVHSENIDPLHVLPDVCMPMDLIEKFENGDELFEFVLKNVCFENGKFKLF